MDENTNQATEVTADLNDIDVSDIDFGTPNEEVEQPTEDTEGTAPESDEADQQEQIEGEADKVEAESEQPKETDQFTLKHLDEVKTVSRDEVIALAQKGLDYDRVKQKSDERYATLEAEKAKADSIISEYDALAKDSGFNSADEMLDDARATMLAEKEGISKQAALKEIRIDRKARELEAKEAKQNAETISQKAAEEKRNADFKEFANEYRDINPKDIPSEVWEMYNKGNVTLVQAMKRHETAKAQAEKDAEIARLKAELEATKKNAENKQRSTGSRSTEGNASNKDPWLTDLESRL